MASPLRSSEMEEVDRLSTSKSLRSPAPATKRHRPAQALRNFGIQVSGQPRTGEIRIRAIRLER